MVTSAERTEDKQPGTGNGPGATRMHVSRRAVFARDLSVWGYELTWPGCGARSEAGASGEHALGAEVALLNALAELGAKSLVADKVAVISVARDTLLGRLPLPTSEGTVLVLRIERGDADRELIEAADERIDAGFQLALSGELWTPEVAPLLERATLIRVPFPQLELGVLDRIGRRPRGQQLWVDGVDQPKDFPSTRPYGPNYVSGDFLLKPSPVEGRRAPRNLSVLMELMTKLRQPDIGFAEIESVLRRDAGLSVTLLRFLNSAGFGLRVQVSNIRQAVALLGLSEFSKWVTLVGLGEASYKPNEVLLTALVRAKTCELLASGSRARPPSGTAFMVGLFSLLDAMLDQPLETVLEGLPLSASLRSALLDQSGFEGEILSAVLDHERGLMPETLPPDTGDLFECWQKAVTWADGLRNALPEARSVPAPRSRR
ncbi:MAG TPA: HDOD domain-containing protein [Polyangiaceae bacterium]|nr:HDOD domain-containing protein [Polyangiaceae bacterium]